MTDMEIEKIFSEALDRFEEKDYAKAVELFDKAAAQGHARAMYNLGICYYDGHGVDVDLKTAAEWYEKAAALGHVKAQFNIGICYLHGRGVKTDEAKAVEWFQKSADQGDIPAICNLGNCYYHGVGVANDDVKAVYYFLKAAEKGDSFAMYNLANACIFGRGVQQDAAQAAEWLEKSAALGNPEAQKMLDEATGGKKYETTFNYLFSHRTLPMSIFNELDFFYKNIIVSTQNFQIYLQNVLHHAAYLAQKHSPDVEPGFTVESFNLGFVGNSIENGVIIVDIPNLKELNDSAQIAIPCMREKAGYFTLELSWNPMDDSKIVIVGEWRPEGEDGNLTHFNYGQLHVENGETFAGKVIKLVYGVDYVPPTGSKLSVELEEEARYGELRALTTKGWDAFLSGDLDTALKCYNELLESKKDAALLYHCRSVIQKARGNDYMADYDMFRAKLIDMDDIANDRPINTEVLKELEFEQREPLIQTEPYFDILQNQKGELLFCIRIRDGEPRLAELFYSGGTSGLFRRRIDQYVWLEEIHEAVREKLSEVKEVHVAEFIPAEEKTKLDKDKGIIREYTVPVRHLPDSVNLESIEEICKSSYPLYASIASLAREQSREGKPIAEIIPKDDLPSLAAILALEEDYALLEKYIAEKLPLNERCGQHFRDWQPTPLFYITTHNAWTLLKEPEKMLRYLVKNGADINLTSGNDDTPLGNQCYVDCDVQIMKAILENGADPNTDTFFENCCMKPLIFLLMPFFEYDSQTHTFTPYNQSKVDRAKLLVEYGADVNPIHESLLTPLALAIAYGSGVLRKELVVYLRNKGAKVDVALKCMKEQAEDYPEYYYALYEFYAGFPDLSESDHMPGMTNWKNPETALRYLQLAAQNDYGPAKTLLAEGEQRGDAWA